MVAPGFNPGLRLGVRAVAALFLLLLTTVGSAAQPPFIDATAASGLDFVHWNGMSGQYYFAEVVGAGGALFDYDNDGDLDLYLIQGRMLGNESDLSKAIFKPRGPLHDRLYRNDLTVNPDGTRTVTFTDVTAASGITGTDYGMGAATADYDNDGDVDLYVTNFSAPNRLWRNDGPGANGTVTFTDATAEAGVGERRWSVPASFFDLDADGWLDLYVGNYMDFTLTKNRPCHGESGLRDYCGPQSYDAEPDRLWRNRGPGADGRVTFEDISSRAGIGNEYGPALGVITADFDGDGRVDVYVANDQAANQLWLNQGADPNGRARFADDAVLLGCALNKDGQPEASMGLAAADFDNDGDVDLFMTHLSRESNTLYTNDGKALFHDRSLESGLANASWRFTGFGTGAFDYDNDGALDLLAANGAVYTIFELARQKDPYPLHQTNQLFRNLGNGRFEETTAGEVFEHSEVSRGALFGDIDNDGDTDVVVTNNSGPARFWQNEVGAKRPWIGLRLMTGDPPRDALGARVAVHRTGRLPLWRRVHTDGSYASASDPRVLIGLGDAAKVTKVEVHWVDGSVETWTDVEVGSYTRLVQGSGGGR